MFKNTAKGLQRPNGLIVEDFDCIYCLYYKGKKKPCPLPRCCCEDERNEAIRRKQSSILKKGSLNE